MVEYAYDLDSVFGSLADPTRRDILRRLLNGELTVGAIAKPYSISFAAISKHLKVLERAMLIRKERKGKENVVYLTPAAIKDAADYLSFYEQLWGERFERLNDVINQM